MLFICINNLVNNKKKKIPSMSTLIFGKNSVLFSANSISKGSLIGVSVSHTFPHPPPRGIWVNCTAIKSLLSLFVANDINIKGQNYFQRVQ